MRRVVVLLLAVGVVLAGLTVAEAPVAEAAARKATAIRGFALPDTVKPGVVVQDRFRVTGPRRRPVVLQHRAPGQRWQPVQRARTSKQRQATVRAQVVRSGGRWVWKAKLQGKGWTTVARTSSASHDFRVKVPRRGKWKASSSRAERVRVFTPRPPVPPAPVDVTAPPVPGGLAGSIGDGEIGLSWDAVAAVDLAGYRVFRAPAESGPWSSASAGVVTGTSATVLGLSNGTPVWLAVTSIDTTGNESTRSAPIERTPLPAQATSDGGRTHVGLGDLAVSAAAESIGAGQSLTVAPLPGQVPGAPEGSLLSSPMDVTTSQGQPSGPVTVTFSYSPAALRAGSEPVVLHENPDTGIWLPEPTTIDPDRATATAVLDSFSGVGLGDKFRWGVGFITGDRAADPITCSTAPDWVINTSFTPPSVNGQPININEPLYSCPGASTDTEFALRVQNNRGHPMAFKVLGAQVDVQRSTWPTTATGLLESALWRTANSLNETVVVLPAGEDATLMTQRPEGLVGTKLVELVELPDGAAVMYSLGLSFLEKASPVLKDNPFGATTAVADCTARFVSSGQTLVQAEGAGLLQDCLDAGLAVVDPLLREGISKALKALAAGLFVVDVGTAYLDAGQDDVFPPGLRFEFKGLPTIIDLSLTNGDLGDLPDGRTTTRQLQATGGTPPYTWTISSGVVNDSRVPDWASLSPSGQLHLEVPDGTVGSFGFYVTIRQANGQQSGTGTQMVRFTTGIAGASQDYIARDPDTGRAVRVVDDTVFDIGDGGTFLCLAETRVVWDNANHPALSQNPTGDTGCDNTGRTRWDVRPNSLGGNVGTDVILRKPDGAASLINSAGEIQTIADGGTYLCLASNRPVIWDVPPDAVDVWRPVGGAPAECTFTPPMVGQLRVGMTIDEAVATGEATYIPPDGPLPHSLAASDPGIYICLDRSDSAIGSFIVKNGNPWTTPEGIGLGSSATQVRVAYPSARTVELGSTYLLVDYGPWGYQFYIAGEVVDTVGFGEEIGTDVRFHC